jgi:DNA-directed RNA polymerase specialized sigma24 family protein
MTLAWAGSYWHEAAFDDPKRLGKIIEAGGPDSAYADDRTPWPRTDETRTFRRLNAIKHALRHARSNAFLKRATLQSELQASHDLIGKRYFGVVCSEYYRAAGRSNDKPEIESTAGLALTVAIRNFNYAIGIRFSTFVTATIRRATRGAHRPALRVAYRPNIVSVARPDAPAPPSDPRLANLLGHLPERHRAVVEMRHGLGGHPGNLSFVEIGNALGVSKERVIYVYGEALGKLRRAAECPGLFDGAA